MEFSSDRCFGQPPLQHFLNVMGAKEWDTVTILTWAEEDSLLNPTYSALEKMVATGNLGNNVRFFKVRRSRRRAPFSGSCTMIVVVL